MLIHDSAARILTCGRILRFDLTEKLVPDSFGEADMIETEQAGGSRDMTMTVTIKLTSS